MRSLYSAVNRRRFGFATTSGSGRREGERAPALANVALFFVGMVVVAAVLTGYWNVADAAPNEGWRRVVIIAASIAGGLCSARYGKAFWKAFVHGL
jgi:hypothetical protein